MQKIYFKILPFIIILIVITTANSQDVTINEVMFDPVGADDYDEFIELYNSGDSAVNLDSMSLKINGNVSQLLVVDSIMGLILQPGSYALIMEKDYLLNHKSKTYDDLIPDTTLLITISKSSFGSGGLRNTSPNDILLISREGDTVGSVVTTPDQSSGFSDEKIIPGGSDEAVNWGNSQVLYGTPGFRNSISPKPYDLAVQELRILTDSLMIDSGASVKFLLKIINVGLYACDSAFVQFGEDMNSDSILQEDEVLLSMTELISIEPGDSLIFQPLVDHLKSGVHRFIGIVYCNRDGNDRNDRGEVLLPVPYPKNCLAINEFMYCPSSGKGGEWVELFNISEDTINLRYWTLSDNATTAELTESDFYLPPEQYAVIANDSSFLRFWGGQPYFLKSLKPIPALNNTSDSIIIRDLCKRRIDALGYSNKWGYATNVSLERKNPFILSSAAVNWALSVSAEGATPGASNSILKWNHDLSILASSFRFVDSTATPGKVIGFMLKIQNSGISASNTFSVEIFHDVNTDSVGGSDELVWSDSFLLSLMPDSIFTVTGEINAGKSGRNKYLAIIRVEQEEFPADNIAFSELCVSFPVNSLTLNEFLPYPNTFQTEFIEIVNMLGEAVDISGWIIANKRTGVNLPSAVIPSGGFLVLTADSSFFNQFPPSSATVVIPKKWPGMNNTADVLTINDLTGKIIDSLAYDESWKLKAGVSFEKILPNLPSQLSSSWQFSIQANGTTAGYLNSVTPYICDLAVDSVAAFLNIGDRETVFSTQIAVRNCGQTRCDSATLILNEIHSNQYTELVRFPIDAVEPEESKMLNVSFGPFCSGMHRLSAVVQWKPDTRKSNDSLTFCVKVAYPEGSLILSEFLAYPDNILTAKSSISEYIEFYNPTQDSICMEGWSVSDENTGRLKTIESSKIVPPGGYFVIASDSSIFKFPEIPSDKVAVMAKFPSLNNDEDRIFLFDPTCSTVDSLWYTSAWKIEQNVAMERVFFTNPNTYNNWRQSVSKSGGTPGLPNSVAISMEMQKPGIRVEPNPFSPDGDGQDEEVAIQYRLPYPSAQISVEVYDIAGRLIYKPGDHVTTSSEGVVYWNGDSEYGDKARTGIYIVKCSAADLGSRKSVGYVTTVVLVRSWR